MTSGELNTDNDFLDDIDGINDLTSFSIKDDLAHLDFDEFIINSLEDQGD